MNRLELLRAYAEAVALAAAEADLPVQVHLYEDAVVVISPVDAAIAIAHNDMIWFASQN